ncbi:MAG: phage tail sheath protein [Chloroflexi bacterium]|nr:MAG: phage tail sheath protein [Chloroflexota bacterium]
MAEMILPGTYIEVRAEGLIAPGQVTVGNLGVVGTASKGPLFEPVLVGSYAEAREIFGDADAFGSPNELTLVRALQLAYNAGANTVFAVRVSNTDTQGDPTALAATFSLAGETANTVAAILTARTPGTWGNRLAVNVFDAEDDSFVEETHDGPGPITLNRAHVEADNPRNKVSVTVAATGQVRNPTVVTTAPTSGQVQIDTNRQLVFPAGEEPVAGDQVFVSYVVPQANSRQVTLRYREQTESYTVADGTHLVTLLNNPDQPSTLASGAPGPNPGELPANFGAVDEFREFGKGADTPGSDGADANKTHYRQGLDLLLNEPAHIMVAAGMDNETIGADLKAHCDVASTDRWKRDRIGVVGSKANATLNDLRGHTLNSDRVILVTPGIIVTDTASGREVTLPGAYTAAVIAGMLSARDPHISLTNKAVPVDKLATRFTAPQLEQLVNARVLAIEEQRGAGIKVVKAITTDDGAFRQITIRRIVDYAKYGVRSASSPYIGLLNNTRVRGRLQATINSFLTGMVDDEMLVTYTLEVTATRDEERRGIARVTMTLQPTFSIDFIKVTMFLE